MADSINAGNKPAIENGNRQQVRAFIMLAPVALGNKLSKKAVKVY